MREMYKAAGIMPEVYDFCESIEKSLEERFKAIDTLAEYNQLKVVMAMQANKVSEAHFQPVMVMMTLAVIRWKKSMRIFFMQKTPSYVRISPAELMR